MLLLNDIVVVKEVKKFVVEIGFWEVIFRYIIKLVNEVGVR